MRQQQGFDALDTTTAPDSFGWQPIAVGSSKATGIVLQVRNIAMEPVTGA